MNIVIDIETACTVDGCSGTSCDHALNPATSEITVFGLKGGDMEVATRDPELVKKLIKGQSLCAFNFKFEHLHLNHHGIQVDMDQWVADPMLMAYVSTNKIPDEWLAQYEASRPAGHRRAGKHSLKTLAPYLLGVAPFWEVQDKDNDEYVLTDVRYTEQLFTHLSNTMSDDEKNFYEAKLLPWTKMLLQAEMRGVCLDWAALYTEEQRLEAKAVELRIKLDHQWAKAHATYRELLIAAVHAKYAAQKQTKATPQRLEAALTKVPAGIEYDSPKQMLWLLRDYLGYDCTTYEGDQSTGREVLERLADQGHEDVRTYLEWRKTNKILTAFIPTYRELAVCEHADLGPLEYIDSVGDAHRVTNTRFRLNPIYNPANTRTGRTSSERPNMQQVPPGLKHIFVPRPGYTFVGYDASAIEAKLIALYTEDPNLYEVISEGISLHNYNARVFFELDCAIHEVASKYPTHRAAAKNVGFALFYNAGSNRIKVAFAQKGFHLTDGQCKAIHARFKQTYTKAIGYANELVAHMETGAVITNLLGRPLRIENPQDCYMQAFNTLIQSSASDLNLEGAYRATKEFKAKAIDATPIMFVHDFVCIEVRQEQAAEAEEILVRCMTNFKLETDLGPIPLTVEGGHMEKWSK